jgi:hypothetical protein
MKMVDQKEYVRFRIRLLGIERVVTMIKKQNR